MIAKVNKIIELLENIKSCNEHEKIESVFAIAKILGAIKFVEKFDKLEFDYPHYVSYEWNYSPAKMYYYIGAADLENVVIEFQRIALVLTGGYFSRVGNKLTLVIPHLAVRASHDTRCAMGDPIIRYITAHGESSYDLERYINSLELDIKYAYDVSVDTLLYTGNPTTNKLEVNPVSLAFQKMRIGYQSKILELCEC